MHLLKCLDSLQFNQNRVLDHQIDEILADNRATGCDSGVMLLRNGESCLTQFKRQRVLVDLLQKPGPELVQHGKCAANNGPGHFIQPIPIRVFSVHLLASA